MWKKTYICRMIGLFLLGTLFVAYMSIEALKPSSAIKIMEHVNWIEHVDYETDIVYVKLHPALVTGSDGACQVAGMVILTIIETIGTNWQVHITNDWVPSKKNPIDYQWAKELAKGY